MKHRQSAVICMTLLLLPTIHAANAQTVKGSRLEPFLSQHCFGCHSGDTPDGGLDLATVSANIRDAEVRRRWVYLYDRIANGEMPPVSADQPDQEAKAKFLKSVGRALTRADLENREVVLRRLNRDEYQNTVRDLFGIYVDTSRLLPDDSVEQGFDTDGSKLSLSPEQLVLYVEAADLVLDQVFGPDRKPERIYKKLNFKDLRGIRSSHRLIEGGGVHFNAQAFAMWDTSVRIPGTYRLRIQTRAVQTDEPLFMQVTGGITMAIAPHVAAFVEVPAETIKSVEILDRALEPSDNWGINLIGGYPWSALKADEYAGPGLFIGDIEVEGPLEEWPPASRAQLLGNVDPAKGTLVDIRAILWKKLPLAFRRTADKPEVEPFVALAKQALDQGLPFEKALRRGLKGMLCASEFLFLEERNVAGTTSHQEIDDFALASRLSYFLWRSMPDQELFGLARRDELKKPEVLRAQVERMLGDPKSQRFVESFTDQWLRLSDIDFTVPDRNLYPEYNQLLRKSMLDETRAFFREILDEDLSVQNFIDSDFVTINQPLAEFYGIDGVKGLDIRRVELPDDSVRGGVLTQASVLKVSADGTRTSPVLRGAWILKYLYGTPSPPPPPTVEAVEPDIRGATTIREQLAKHREHESCNRCHRKIDPPGFALESFDVIGAQRDWYRTREQGKWIKRLLHPQNPRGNVLYRQGPDVDCSGAMPDGRAFTDIREYKRLLLDDETAIARALTGLLLAYSLGRQLGFSDRSEVERIVAEVKADDYGLRSLIHEITRSETFRAP